MDFPVSGLEHTIYHAQITTVHRLLRVTLSGSRSFVTRRNSCLGTLLQMESSVEESLYEVAANEKSCGVYRAFKRPGRPV